MKEVKDVFSVKPPGYRGATVCERNHNVVYIFRYTECEYVPTLLYIALNVYE